MIVHPLVLTEYGTVTYRDLGEAAVLEVERLTERLGVPLFRFQRDRLQARQYVGVIHVGGRTIQILPKIYPNETENLALLVFMLGYTRRLRLHATSSADLAEVNGSLLETWIRSFAIELNALLRHHMQRYYVEVEERIGFIRGKLLVAAMQSGREALTGRYPCRFEVFTTDHLLNRALKFCNGLLRTLTAVPSTQALLRENAAMLDDVADVPVRESDLDRIHLNRLNRRYEPILEMCRVLLRSATFDLRAGRIAQLAFVVDMNRLYEEFIAECLRRHAPRLRFSDGTPLRRIDPQHHLGKLFGEFAMQVDLHLVGEDGRCVLLDTKYKRLDPEARHHGMSQSDFYQMYGYGRAGRQPFDEIILLYPHAEVVPRTYHSGDLRLHVRTLDLRGIFDPRTGRLREERAISAFQAVLA